ncbi:MAG: MoxR family ATPase [Gemmatimonadetes bacterium]|nr:MoxR family ATPase [Gemmatimonadota bacterium]
MGRLATRGRRRPDAAVRRLPLRTDRCPHRPAAAQSDRASARPGHRPLGGEGPRRGHWRHRARTASSLDANSAAGSRRLASLAGRAGWQHHDGRRPPRARHPDPPDDTRATGVERLASGERRGGVVAEHSHLTAEEAVAHAETASRVLTEIQRVVLGQEVVVRESLHALLAAGHVLLEGPPGTAKTLLVRAFNEALGLAFRRIQFTADLMPSDITGVSILNASGDFTFRAGPLFADLVLADEINRAPAKTQAALLEAMGERSVTVDGTSHPMSASFTVFATQNPIEFEGTYPLPEAELDRFLIKSTLGYPEADVESGVLHRVLGGFDSSSVATFGIQQVLDATGLATLRAAVRRVRVELPLVEYITALVRATRNAPALTLGASPRASVALLKVAQAAALVDGREYVTPDDVKRLAPAVLRHRVVVAPELELEGVSADDALSTLIQRIEAPRG